MGSKLKKKKEVHTCPGLKGIKCHICNLEVYSQNALDSHFKESHVQCNTCQYVTGKQEDLEAHIQAWHKEVAVKLGEKVQIKCELCSFKCVYNIQLKKHIKSHHDTAKCETCVKTFINVQELNEHKLKEHVEGYFKCDYCQQSFDDESAHKDHMLNRHEEIVVMYTMAKQIDVMEEKLVKFEVFQNQVMSLITNVKDTQNEIKQELFLLRNNQQMLKKTNDLKLEVPKNEEPIVSNVESPVLIDNNAAIKLASKQLLKKRKEVVWVGTPISRPMDFNQLERDMKADMKVVEIDSIRNGRRGSRRSLKDGVETALRNHQPDIIVLQAGTEEISCLDVLKATKDEGKNFDECRKKWVKYVEEDSKDIYKIAEDVVKHNGDLEVVIVERLPRYDTRSEDPLNLKQELSTYANTVYKQEWFRKGSPKNIHIVSIPLNCESYPHLKQLIYGRSYSSSFDGHSLKGSGASRHLTYRTKQVIWPLVQSSFNSSQQTGFLFPRKSKKSSNVTMVNSEIQSVGAYQYSVPVKNRFMRN